MFDYPVTGPEGDAEAALAAIEQYCGEKELPLVLSVVPEDKAAQLILRYPRVRVISERPWKDYLYRTEELAQFAGRRYSGQRNHINKFRRDYPDAEFVALTDPADPRLAAFWRSSTRPGRWPSRSWCWRGRCLTCWIPAGSAPGACWRRDGWWPSVWRRSAAVRW